MPGTASDLLQQYFDHWLAGEDDDAAAMWADDVILHFAGRNRYSGSHEGKAWIDKYLEEVERKGGSKVVEVYVLFGDDTHAAVAYREDLLWEETFSLQRFNHYRFENGKIVEIWVYEEDQYATDEFFEKYA